MDIMKPATFRFKFTNEFQEELNAFAKLHRFDNRADFKDAWEKWTQNNETLVEKECGILKSAGYKGLPINKMYKSARYYFRTKKDEKNEPKKRRTYVSLASEMIILMDEHLMESLRNADFKPSIAFDTFCEKFTKEISDEITRLYTQKNLNKSEISEKFKKTYKNRYFQKIKSQT